MILPQPHDALHKAWLYRLLSAISDNRFIAEKLAFKGGTAAAMQGYLDRFSIDLDFDYINPTLELKVFRKNFEVIFEQLGLSIKDSSDNTAQYFLNYPVSSRSRGVRNTVKIDVTFPPPKANIYEKIRFKEIDRIVNCQTIETMFANKLVALIDRFEKNGSIAGRDIYDIHHYFLNGFRYHEPIILERRGLSDIRDFFSQLVEFIHSKITQTIINQDLNHLLEAKKFKTVRKTIKAELILMLQDEILRCKTS
jgi:predicted nucleotidyltransferase component of viral defense system